MDDSRTDPPPSATPPLQEFTVLAPTLTAQNPGSNYVPPGDFPSIPGYEIFSQVGDGGMGVVYCARQVRADRIVALKTLRNNGSREGQRRFEVEARVIASIDHAHVVKVFDVGEYGGTPYFALEYCPAGSLQARFAGTPWEPRDAAETLEKIARGVGAVHRKGVVHRDLKPGNVLLGPDGEPKVTDFGLAKRMDSDGMQTVEGTFMGTPDYMAPEQTQLVRGAIAPTADVFSLGVILYQSLTGLLPFWAPGRAEKLHRTCHVEPVPPRGIRPQIPRDLETICLKCLQKEPARRYATAEELADDLARFLAGKATLARPATATENLVRWVRRNPLPAAFVGFLLLSFVAVSVLAAVAWRAERRASELAGLAQRNARRAEEQQLLGVIPFAALEIHAGNHPRASRLLAEIPPARRGWEWEHLSRCNPKVDDFPGPLDRVTAVALIPGRQKLVAVGQDRVIRVWDLATRELLASRAGFPRAMWSVAVHPDGQQIAVGGEHGELWVWDWQRDRVRFDRINEANPPPAERATISALAYSPDGSTLVSGGHYPWLEYRDAADPRRRLASVEAHGGVIEGLCFTPAGQLVSFSFDRTVKLWEPLAARPTRVLQFPGAVTALALDPAGQEALVGLGNGMLSRWHLSRGELRMDYPVQNERVTRLAWSGDGRQFAAATQAGEVALFDRDLPRPTGRLPPHAGEVRGLIWLGRDEILSCGFDHRVRRLQFAAVEQGALCDPRGGHRARVTALSIDPEGRRMASVSMDRTLKIWDLPARRVVRTVPHAKDLWAVAIAPDGQRIATAGDAGEILIWLPEGEQAVAALRPPEAERTSITSLAWSPDGKSIWSGSHDGTTRRWDVESGGCETLRDHQNRVETLSLSRSGRLLATGSWDQTITLRTSPLAPDGRAERLTGHTAFVTCVAISPDERLLASASDDRTVRIWDVPSGKLLHTLETRIGKVFSVAWSPDSQRLIYAGQDGDVRLWHVELREELLTLAGNRESIKCLQWGPSGDDFFAGGWEQSVRAWSRKAPEDAARK